MLREQLGVGTASNCQTKRAVFICNLPHSVRMQVGDWATLGSSAGVCSAQTQQTSIHVATNERTGMIELDEKYFKFQRLQMSFHR